MKLRPTAKRKSRTALAIERFDEADPPMSCYRAAKESGIAYPTLYQALKLRERHETARCPTCGLYPGQRARRTGPGRQVPRRFEREAAPIALGPF